MVCVMDNLWYPYTYHFLLASEESTPKNFKKHGLFLSNLLICSIFVFKNKFKHHENQFKL